MKKEEIEFSLSTDDVARIAQVKPETVLRGYMRKGHYYGLVPRKLPNGKLIWPTESKRMLLEYRPEPEAA